jgi:fatty acid synthase subunit alpha, fungi type
LNVVSPPFLYQGSMSYSTCDIFGQASCSSMHVIVISSSCPTHHSQFSTDFSKKVHVAQLNSDMRIGKYIPNLVAKTFDVSREYVQLIYAQTLSPSLDKVLKRWDQDNWASPEQRQKLACIILIELLAYQFVSPVRWIETQDHPFKDFAFERFIEIGPLPTLTGMAMRPLKAKYEVRDDSIMHPCVILCHAKHSKEIYHQFEDKLLPLKPSLLAGEGHC